MEDNKEIQEEVSGSYSKGFTLSEEHKNKAIEILQKHITKRFRRKGCKRCDLRGYSKIDEYNLVYPCQCVNEMPAREEWLQYCLGFPELEKEFIRYCKDCADFNGRTCKDVNPNDIGCRRWHL